MCIYMCVYVCVCMYSTILMWNTASYSFLTFFFINIEIESVF